MAQIKLDFRDVTHLLKSKRRDVLLFINYDKPEHNARPNYTQTKEEDAGQALIDEM
jgi:hypothetical protein